MPHKPACVVDQLDSWTTCSVSVLRERRRTPHTLSSTVCIQAAVVSGLAAQMKPKHETRGLFFSFSACSSVRQSVGTEAREGHVSAMLPVLLSDAKILQASDVQDLLL